MSISITPIDPARHLDFAGLVDGIDLRQPVSDENIAAIEAGMDRFAVLVFRNQPINDDQQVAFACSFGPLEHATGDLAQGDERRLRMELNDISNVNRDGTVMARDDRKRLFGLGNLLWHSDSSFKANPAKYSMLSARVLPARDGNTEFADMRAAYDALDATIRTSLKDLICAHTQIHSRGTLGFTDFTEDERIRFAPVRQRLVRRHPVTGRLSFFLSSHAGGIEGWPVPEALALLRDLAEHATARPFVYAHVWQPHDLVIWDNRTTMHRARRFDPSEMRDLRRTTLEGDGPTVEQTLQHP
jgi:alpha-ketoglutarate-dependent 2,4-dichlorophenoxyacetate dioxygenase